MNTIATVATLSAASPAKSGASDRLHLDQLSIEPASADAAQFRAALERHMHHGDAAKSGPAKLAAANENSLGEKIMARTTTMAEQVRNDQQHVSKMLEQASRNGDSMQMMKAMMALNDYQMRVQFISKTVAKATSSVDQLTKLQ